MNPCFDISVGVARDRLAALARGRTRGPTHRPTWEPARETPGPGGRLLVLGGWRAPNVAGRQLAAALCRAGAADPRGVLTVSFLLNGSVAGAMARVRRALAWRGWGRYDHASPLRIVGISMGGLVARALVAGLDGLPRLKARDIYTLATPHMGAVLADLVRPDAAARDLRAGSDFLGRLDDAWGRTDPVCPVRPYALLRDAWVGATRCGLAGRPPLWLDPHGLGRAYLSHFTVSYDPRIVLDLALSLRGDGPAAREGAPPPTD